jgi:hypothetical protein
LSNKSGKSLIDDGWEWWASLNRASSFSGIAMQGPWCCMMSNGWIMDIYAFLVLPFYFYFSLWFFWSCLKEILDFPTSSCTILWASKQARCYWIFWQFAGIFHRPHLCEVHRRGVSEWSPCAGEFGTLQGRRDW